MASGYYIHASPTLFNAGTNNQQLSSCFLLGLNDSLTETYITKVKESYEDLTEIQYYKLHKFINLLYNSVMYSLSNITVDKITIEHYNKIVDIQQQYNNKLLINLSKN